MPSNLSHSEDAENSRQTATNKVPLSDQKKKGVLIFEIKSADSTEWARWYLDMSGGDEMRAQKIPFILCIELSLKTSLNSALSGEHHVACLGISAIYISLQVESVRETVRRVKTRVWPSWYGSYNSPDEHLLIIYKQRTHVWPYCLSWERKLKHRSRRGGGRRGKKNFYMVNSMCPILSCWCYAEVGGRWAGWVKIQSFYAHL